MRSKWVVVWESTTTGEFLEHRNGVAWHDAPIPRKFHRCTAQSRGFILSMKHGPVIIERCACGAVNFESEGWDERNTRFVHPPISTPSTIGS